MASFATHAVTNQSAAYADINLFSADAPLREAVAREGGQQALAQLEAFGATAGSSEAFEHARLANEHPPRLRTHDPKGHRLDIVEFHPSWHWLMTTSTAEGLQCSAWGHLAVGPGQPTTVAADGPRPPRPGANVERAGAFYLAAQMEAGHCCPLTMTNAAIASLLNQPDVADAWLPRILTRSYDASFSPAPAKSAVTLGMGLTEKQGGTDVRSNTTTAVPVDGGGPGGRYLLTGHKWFMSAPMSDAFLVLAQAPAGLSCFLMPRFTPERDVNAIRFLNLKDKLGNRSNASAEAEFESAHAVLIGEEGRGVPVIIEMVMATRLDCAVSSAALMRLAVASALHHCRQRSAFGRALSDQPIMAHLLADLALDVEAATALSFRLARSFDRVADPRASAWRRLMTPVTKYWVCKTATAVVAEAMECLGGNGYVETTGMSRLYREAPVNSIWEGSGNVMALDVLRIMQREPDVLEIVMDDLAIAVGDDIHLKAALERVRTILHEPRFVELRSRALLEGLALLAAGSILRAQAPAAIADAFVAARLSGVPRFTYGQGLEWSDTKAIMMRMLPA